MPGPIRLGNALPAGADGVDLGGIERTGFEQGGVFAPATGPRGSDDGGVDAIQRKSESQGDGGRWHDAMPYRGLPVFGEEYYQQAWRSYAAKAERVPL